MIQRICITGWISHLWLQTERKRYITFSPFGSQQRIMRLFIFNAAEKAVDAGTDPTAKASILVKNNHFGKTLKQLFHTIPGGVQSPQRWPTWL